jgi:DNA-binding MarR family transcriptional regulator
MAPDEIIHQTMRLRLMASLSALPFGEMLEFTRLKQMLEASDGNLGAHILTLEKAGYIRTIKDFVGRKPRTRVSLTKAGAKAYAAHAAYLRSVLDG